MNFTEKQKQWIGAIASLLIQFIVSFVAVRLAGDFVAVYTILGINIYLAANYKNQNPYFTGARWSSFFCLSYMTVIRHTYWYETVLANFTRLRDLYKPVDWDLLLRQGTREDMWMVTTSSALVLLFYFFVIRWDDWSGRWEMVRRALLSSSMGLQFMIVATVVYPTPLTMISSLVFASLVSPIMRRQVRLNHVIFMLLPPLFSLGIPELSFPTIVLASIAFIIFTSFERSLSTGLASFTLFNGVAFFGFAFTTFISRTGAFLNVTGSGLLFLSGFVLLTLLTYFMVFRGERLVLAVRRLLFKIVPKRLQQAKWWNVRDLWVDREIDHRVNKRYSYKNVEKSLGTFFFGPKDWIEGTEEYARTEFARINLTPAIVVLSLFSVRLMVDAILSLTDISNRLMTFGSFVLGFAVVAGVPLALLVVQLRDRGFYKLVSILTAGTAAIAYLAAGVALFYIGLQPADADTDSSSQTSASATLLEN